MNDQELLAKAQEARGAAYVPYSQFPVGAAVLTDDGQVYLGCNIENASFGLTNCAERTAIFKAVSEGHHRFTAIAVVGDTEGPCAPCGACRQVMAEWGLETRVILSNLKGETWVGTVADLLPGAFTPADLR